MWGLYGTNERFSFQNHGSIKKSGLDLVPFAIMHQW